VADATSKDYQITARIERLPFSNWHLKIGTVIGTGWFFDAFDALAIAYVLPVLIGMWKLSPGDIGLLIAIGYAGQIVGSIFFGWLAERIGRVPCTLYTLAIFTVMSFACIYAWNVQSLMAIRFLQGLGLGGEIPVMATYISEFANARRRGRLGLGYQMLFTIGLSVVALVAAWVVPAFGWQWMFVIGAAPALLVLPLRRLLPESPRWLARQGRLEEADRVLTGIENEISQHGAKPLAPIPADVPPVSQAATRFGDLFRGIYLSRTVTVWIIWFCSYLIVYGLSTWMPSIYRTVYKLPVQQSLNYSLAAAAFGTCCAIVAVFIIDIIGRKALFAIGQFLSAIPLLYLGFHTDLEPLQVLFLVAFGFGCNSMLAISLSTYTAELYPTELRALGCGVGNSWLRFASVIGPFFIGWIIPRYGLGSVFLVFGIAAVIGGITAAFFATETRGKILEKLSPSLSS
jgi:MFS transporter, putative metabolite:H+ symporter